LCAADFHRHRLRLGSRQRCCRRVYIIGRRNKGQQVFGKRYGSFSKKPGGPFPPALRVG
jgi:hypothetical protein